MRKESTTHRRGRRFTRSNRAVGNLLVVALMLSSVAIAASPANATTYPEQQGRHGANTFRNYHNASDMGPRVEPASWVDVSCKVYDPYIQSANPDGYWYRLASNPWNNEFYAVANTFMNGDPWGGPYSHNTDFNVPDCGSSQPQPEPQPQPQPSSTQPPPSSPHVNLARGPAAPSGYWYSITLDNFPDRSANVSCRDSADPHGFREFTLQLDGNGHGFTARQCYSADGPDHWVVANGVESNHVSWAGSSGGGGGFDQRPPQRPPDDTPPVDVPPSTTGASVFYSGTGTPTGLAHIQPGDQNIAHSDFSTGNCGSAKAVSAVNFSQGDVTTLAGWSKGRLGPIYFLQSAGTDRVEKIRRIVLFDPGHSDQFRQLSSFAAFLNGGQNCDWQVSPPINSLLADWLKSNQANRLIVITGEASQDKAGLWKYYFAGLWNQPFADRSLVCDYGAKDHVEVIEEFYYLVNSPRFQCPNGYETRWHP